MEYFKTFRDQSSTEIRNTGDVFAGPRQTRNQPNFDGVGSSRKDDWNCRGNSFGREGRWCASLCNDYGDGTPNQFKGKGRQAIVVIVRPAVLDSYVSAFEVTGISKASMKCRDNVSGRFEGCAAEIPDDPNCGPLRPRHHGPRRRARETSDKITPLHVAACSRSAKPG